MMQGLFHKVLGSTGIRAVALVASLACFADLMAAPAASSLLNNQGYLLLHPMFKSLPWKATMGRLDLTLPDTLASIPVKSFDVSRGVDNAVAVFTTATNDLFIMPALHEKLVAPCIDHVLSFDPPQKVPLSGLSLSSAKPLYVVRDSLYSADSIRVAAPSSIALLKVLVATIRSANATVTRIDTVVLTERRTGQQILGISGATDSITGQDLGIWVTGTNGMIRYIPYTNHRFGTEAVRDLGASEATVSVTHTNGTFAVSTQGKIYRKNPADTFFTFAVAASGALRRVYSGGAIGDNGLFKEFANGSWRADKTFGSASYRYANFIRRFGGFGIELLDSSWAYSVFTYRDTSSRIAATQPASLSTNINGLPYVYASNQQLDITVMLDDPDSNFSDYSLSQVSAGGGTSVDLKNDGKYAIVPLSDSVDCHINSIKMTSGRVRLTINGSQVTVMHDCALGAPDPTCLTCYWKSYNFQLSKFWQQRDTIKIKAGQHLLRIVNNISVTLISPPAGNRSRAYTLTARFASGYEYTLRLPMVKSEARVSSVEFYDIQGRHLATRALRPNQQRISLPDFGAHGIFIIAYRMDDGTMVKDNVPVMGR
jgi:hypothetical protein